MGMDGPPQTSPGEVTRLLREAARGSDDAARELYQHVYDELHRLARAHMKDAVAGHTLQPTALVHEAWVRLARVTPSSGQDSDASGQGSAAGYRDRDHFLSVASRAMRSALVDQVRRRKAEKRGGDRSRVPLEVAVELYQARGVDLIALDDALDRLMQDEPRQARVVELRFFGGLTTEEAARSIGVSVATAERDWRMARAWLKEELAESA